ncbi:terminase [Mycobacterium sp. 852013-51886_SCH5428379]|uniref:terminase n=1 Tax=Mycobacterium sp. 852013-51886_SCH5428379 TaxID=1834111 RepID=UPI0007FCB8D6|nr:terminase [Mycobacterium sp. 852013-51886_SCH5428379]OBB57955.1 terminase [Mycobacterium sp. 852013-51886_SCH5428379]
MPAGPKRASDPSPLPFNSDLIGAERFAAWAHQFLTVPKGRGAGEQMRIRPWQVEMLRPFLDPVPRPVIGAIMGPRGLGKTGIFAALGLYELFEGPQGNEIPIVAVDERMAMRLLSPAAQMVALNPALANRAQVFRDHIDVPGKRSSLMALPAEAKRIEGLGTWSIALADEIGEIDPDTWTTLLLGAGKLDAAMVLGIGTPPNRDQSVLTDLRSQHLANPDAPTLAFVEFSAAGFEHHDAACVHCLELANPQLDDLLDRHRATALLAQVGEAEYRRKRLCQVVTSNEHPFVNPSTWEGLSTVEPIPEGVDVVIGLDGAFGGRDSDACALIIGTVSATPHFDVLACYENPGDPNWRVDLLQVERDIRDAAKRYNVREVVADPFRLGRTLQVLQAEGLTVSEFPWSPSRLTKVTTALHGAVLSGEFTHSGHETLTRHALAAQVIDANGGLRIGKTSRKRSAGKIDCLAALLMAWSRATWLANNTRKRRSRVIGI